MARKKKEEKQAPGAPAWMSTFSDLMNLLLCFFILLFASSTVDAEKMEAVAASFSKYSIFTAGSKIIGDGKMVSSGVKQISLLDEFVTKMDTQKKGDTTDLSDKQDNNDQKNDSASDQMTTQAHQDTQDTQSTEQVTTESLEQQMEKEGYQQSEVMNEEIEKMLQNSQISDKVSLSYNAQYVELSLNGGILFDSGKAELSEDAKPLMNKVGSILTKYRKRVIEIEGHTDNVPAGGTYKDNNYLSAARAISVYEYLLNNNNLIEKNMKHSGYGDSRPKASNKTASGRAKNRRVEIKIYNKISSAAQN